MIVVKLSPYGGQQVWKALSSSQCQTS